VTIFDSMEIRRTQALWYAWGQIDTGTLAGLTHDDGFRFAEQQAQAQAEFDAERTHVLHGLTNAWQEYVAARRQELHSV
jgi:hypothetical protein